MDIKLVSLKLENFKAVRKAEYSFDGKNVNISGDNATGKTTIFDAFMWLLFDKNSNDNKVFEVKTLNSDGTHIPNLEHTVEAVLLVNDQKVLLTKIMKENWVRRRNAIERVFDGHVIEYYIDMVPKLKRDYEKYIGSLIDQSLFRMLTNPLNFNELDWKKRREVIINLSGDLSNSEVIASDYELKDLEEILLTKSPEDAMSSTKASIRRVKDTIDSIPTRIDELSKISKPARPKEAIEYDIKLQSEEKEKLLVQKANGDISKEVYEIEFKITQLKQELLTLQINPGESEKKRKIEEKNREISEKTSEKRNFEMAINQLENEKSFAKREIESLKSRNENILKRRENLYQEYDQENAKMFNSQNCASCGQLLPADKQAELEYKFNQAKSLKLTAIIDEGRMINSEVDNNAAKINELEVQIQTSDSCIEQMKANQTTALNQLMQLQQELNAIFMEPVVNPNLDKIAVIQNQINQFYSDIEIVKSKDIASTINSKLWDVDKKIGSFNVELAEWSNYEKTQKRIFELKDELEDNMLKYEELEITLNLLEKFTRRKMQLLESRINGRFELVNWKMFNQNINGGIEETCIATVNGVPFADLNNAMKINAGLDVIKTLQRMYQVSAPIFIDNAEAVTKYIDLGSTQVIKLYVVAGKKLTIEVQ